MNALSSRHVRLHEWSRITVFCLVFTGAACSAGEGDGGAKASPTPQGAPVRVAVAEREDVPVTLRAVGMVEAGASVEIRPQVSGEVARIGFEEGGYVKRGDLLVELDRRPFAAALDEARGRLARDRADAAFAEAEVRRRKTLLEEEVVPRADYESYEARAKAARAGVVAEEAAVRRAELELAYCSIHAPIDGRLGERRVDPGDVVKAQETVLAHVAQTRPVRVAFSVPQRELPEIRRRAAAGELAVEARPPEGEAIGGGRLDFIDNVIDPASGTIGLKASFANDDEVLWPGQSVRVVLTLAVREQAVVIPSRAVAKGQDGDFVFVVGRDGRAGRRPVELAESHGDRVAVASGVEAGETVVVEGQLRLVDGSPVAVLDEPGAAGARDASEERAS